MADLPHIRLHELQFRQILGIDQADWFAFGVGHDQVVDIPFIENPKCLDRQSFFPDMNGLGRHYSAQGLRQYLAVSRHVPSQIAVSEDAD
jgi:hypothetical protein